MMPSAFRNLVVAAVAVLCAASLQSGPALAQAEGPLSGLLQFFDNLAGGSSASRGTRDARDRVAFAAPRIDRDGRSFDPRYRRQVVRYRSQEKPGTIIIDTRAKFLYLIEPNDRARRYGIGVGREGFGWRGTVRVGRKATWPTWTPPAPMIRREPRLRRFASGMPGGVNNPLGARALYLYNGGRDTLFRIHGTNEPWTIGRNVSSGCIRLRNEDVIDLYNRARVGAKVIVR